MSKKLHEQCSTHNTRDARTSGAKQEEMHRVPRSGNFTENNSPRIVCPCECTHANEEGKERKGVVPEGVVAQCIAN